MHGRGCTWQWACMAGGHVWQEGGHAWQGIGAWRGIGAWQGREI